MAILSVMTTMTMSIKGRLLVVQGPTGVGKTAVGITLAQHYGIPVVSADSRQIYREMTIGTAVPSPEELSAATHYFIQHKSIHESFSAGDYEREGLELLDNLFGKYSQVLLVGGSGLYVDALLNGFDDLPESDPTLRTELSALPMESLLAELQERDPGYYHTVDRNNPQRIVRAVEVCRLSGRPYSELRSGQTKTRPFNTLKIGINLPRETLYDRINRRVDQMMEKGLLHEAEQLYPYRHLSALQTVGYRELFEYFAGHISLPEAVELIKRNTRHYAKRQLTWLRRDTDIRWFEPSDTKNIIACIDEIR